MTRPCRPILTLTRFALTFGLLAILWAWPSDAGAHPAPLAHAPHAQNAGDPDTPAGHSAQTCCHHDGTCSAKAAAPDAAPATPRRAHMRLARLPSRGLLRASHIGGADPPPPRL